MDKKTKKVMVIGVVAVLAMAIFIETAVSVQTDPNQAEGFQPFLSIRDGLNLKAIITSGTDVYTTEVFDGLVGLSQVLLSGDVLIDFDELSEGTRVTPDTYAGQGIKFFIADTLFPPDCMVIEDVSGTSWFAGASLPNVLTAHGYVPGPNGWLACNWDLGGEFVDPETGETTTVSSVSVLVFATCSNPPQTIKLMAFSEDDVVLAEDEFTLTSVSDVQSFTLTVSATGIARVETFGITGNDICADYDNFVFIPTGPETETTISTDKFKYSPGDTMTVTLDIANPTEESVFQWYWGVPKFSVWLPVMSAPIPAGYDDTHDFSFTLPNWGPTPFGNVFYVQLLDAGGEVLDADCECWAYMQLGAKGEVLDADCERWCECWAYMQLHDAGGEAMPAVDIGEEIMKTIERVELP